MTQIEIIHKKLIETGKTLALAESCTGGHLASLFTQMPNASKYLLGSLVTYCNQFKEELLHVSKETLRVHGAVSRETANEMLLGLMKLSKADFGIAITGVAGPTGGSADKPVGTVYIALGQAGKKPHVIESHFEGSRIEIISQSAVKAIDEFCLFLK